ncbi:MAG: ABC transporter permease, partial [Candidatus Nomurabacteria bacterium]|nr:ABC transporter permease [Candidatus Nomurabacteria bacterium]
MKKFKEKYRYSLILLRELVKTDFKLRYEGSVLGMLWSALKPLLLFGVMYVVFVHFLKFGAGVPFFAAALLLAIVLWNFFQESTSQGMTAIV